jgi:hypothetical protein
MKPSTFRADQFTPTQWDTAEDKAKFANQFVKLVESGFVWHQFPKWFYKRLSMTFGHIAHFNQHGFYDAQFSGVARQLEFLVQTQTAGGYGDPHFTYSDVELQLRAWVKAEGFIDLYQTKLNTAIEASERETLKRLQVKYGR